MSAAPIEFVMFHPKANDEPVAYKRAAVARKALWGFWTIAINPMIFSRLKGLLRYLFMGNSNVHFIPLSFKNAAIDPVKVIPPITVPK